MSTIQGVLAFGVFAAFLVPTVRAAVAFTFRCLLLFLVLFAAAECSGGSDGQARLEANLDRFERLILDRGTQWASGSKVLLMAGRAKVVEAINGGAPKPGRTSLQ